MAMMSGSRVFKAAKSKEDVSYTRKILTLDWNDELRNDWENLGSALLEHVKDSLYRQKSIWVHLLSNAFKEDWQVVMEVKLSHIYLPVDSILWSMLNGNWKITSVVEPTELRWSNHSSSSGTCFWLQWGWFFLWFKCGETLSSDSHTLLKNG